MHKTYHQWPPYGFKLKAWNRTFNSALVSTTTPNLPVRQQKRPKHKNRKDGSLSEVDGAPGWSSAGRPSDSCRRMRSPGKKIRLEFSTEG